MKQQTSSTVAPKVYPPELREKVLARFKGGELAADLAKEFKVPLPSIYYWAKASRRKEKASVQIAKAKSNPSTSLSQIQKVRDLYATRVAALDVALAACKDLLQ